jgi:hypothetical protein
MAEPRRAAARALTPALLLAALAAGVFLRAGSGTALLSSNLVYAAGLPATLPGTRTPEDTARSFYLLLDRGEYAKAWDLALEPDWNGGIRVPYRSALVPSGSLSGWTGKPAFVERLTDELGAGGYWLRLNGVEATENPSGAPLEPVVRERLGAQLVTPVHVTGSLLGACTIFHWEKDLPVVRIGKGYKVLLPGTKAANEQYYQAWFTNIRKIGTLRGTSP